MPTVAAGALISRAVGPTGGAAVVTVEPAGIALIKRTAARGASMGVVAAALGIAKSTLQKTMARDEAVLLAWEGGKAVDEAHHLGVLNKAANKGYAAASMFLLKTRHGYRETDDAQQGNVTNLQIVSLPAPMTPQAYAVHLAARDAATQATQAALPAPIDVESKDVGRLSR
jgi:hypothetical protein